MLVKVLNIQCAHKQFQTPVLVWYCKKKKKESLSPKSSLQQCFRLLSAYIRESIRNLLF